MYQETSPSISPTVTPRNPEIKAARRQEPGKTQPLTLAQIGRKLYIASVTGGRTVKSRLASLGLLPGQQVQVVRLPQFGPIVVSVKGTRLALGRGVAHKILVTEAPAG